MYHFVRDMCIRLSISVTKWGIVGYGLDSCKPVLWSYRSPAPRSIATETPVKSQNDTCISQLRDFARSGIKTIYSLMVKGPDKIPVEEVFT